MMRERVKAVRHRFAGLKALYCHLGRGGQRNIMCLDLRRRGATAINYTGSAVVSVEWASTLPNRLRNEKDSRQSGEVAGLRPP